MSYGGSDSEPEEEERGDTGGGGGVKETAVSFKKTGLIKYQKDTSGKVKVYLPELDHKEIARTDKVPNDCIDGLVLIVNYLHYVGN